MDTHGKMRATYVFISVSASRLSGALALIKVKLLGPLWSMLKSHRRHKAENDLSLT